MADRSESHNELGNYLVERAKAQGDSAIEDEFRSGSPPALIDTHPGARPLLHLTKKPLLTPVPRPHNAAVFSGSAFADANLPVVNVHVKRKKLELRGH